MNLVGPAFEIIKFRKNLQKLKEHAQDLSDREDDIKQELERNRVGKVPTNKCESWLPKVEDIQKEISMIEKEHEEDKKCFLGLCPDVLLHMNLGKRVTKAIDPFIELKEKSKFEGGLVLAAEFMPLPIITHETSIQRTLQKILACIRDTRIQRIGIWGMGGIRKTTLMKVLNNSQESSRAFDIVIWVTVSRQWRIRRIQREIGERLLLHLTNGELTESAARKISEILRSKKYLLLLDDVWEKIPLLGIGILGPSQEDGSKMVLTTRSLNVCKRMETDAEVKVEVLSNGDAWELFSLKAGQTIHSRSITPLAISILEECCGLPLAIVVMGSALRNIDDVCVWRNALRELQSPASCTSEEMEDCVYKPLKFSYDQLGNDNTNHCFLYCALYPKDHKIEGIELTEYWRVEGLNDDARTIVEAYDKGRAILNTLVQLSLLETFGSQKYVMHDVIKGLALRIVSARGNGFKFLVRAGLRHRNPSMEEEWKQKHRISLMYNELSRLPGAPDCPMLSTLLLQRNENLRTIPCMFFQYMVGLRVLDLSDTLITSLPSAICNLISLRGLYQNRCYKLVTLPSEVGSLKELEALQLLCTGIRFLPVEIDELTHLICLLVSSPIEFYVEERIRTKIPLGVISRLILLQHLAIDVYMDSRWWIGNIDAILEEVAGLSNLANLELCFPRVGYLERFLSLSCSWREGSLLAFQFSVGNFKSVAVQYTNIDWYKREHDLFYGSLNYRAGNCDIIPSVIVDVLNRSNRFELTEHKEIKRLCEVGMENMKGLKLCVISKWRGV